MEIFWAIGLGILVFCLVSWAIGFIWMRRDPLPKEKGSSRAFVALSPLTIAIIILAIIVGVILPWLFLLAFATIYFLGLGLKNLWNRVRGPAMVLS